MILEELPDGLQAPVAQVIDVIDVADAVDEVADVVHHRDHILRGDGPALRTAVAQDLHRASPVPSLEENGGHPRCLQLHGQPAIDAGSPIGQDLPCLGIDGRLFQHAANDPLPEAELLVEFIAANGGQIVAPRIVKEAFEEAPGAFGRWRLARPQPFIDLD